MKDKVFFIPGAVPSSKNSRFLTKSGLFIASAATQKYRKLTVPYWKKYKKPFHELTEGKKKPFIIGIHFVRGSHHKWDFINPVQTIQDEMTKHGWIDDDNSSEILPIPLVINDKSWSYDKNHPGVYITVLDNFCDGTITITDFNHTEPDHEDQADI